VFARLIASPSGAVAGAPRATFAERHVGYVAQNQLASGFKVDAIACAHPPIGIDHEVAQNASTRAVPPGP
jgi:hypothetical protein